MWELYCTRPWGRVQHSRPSHSASNKSIQSSPARGGGCNFVWRPKCPIGNCVSILTRPWGRVQLAGRAPAGRATGCFNPHPPVGAGATRAVCAVGEPCGHVSILTRPWGRVQRYLRRARRTSSPSFNPHPPVGAGAASPPYRSLARGCGFNPHPPVGAGATKPLRQRCADTHLLFQSSPARGGGCNAAHSTQTPADTPHVSILTRPWGRVQHLDWFWVDEAVYCPVSILTRPWGRVQHRYCARDNLRGHGFNPHPPVGRVQLYSPCAALSC